ncbi:hypothetical protein BJV74DRAFT_136248 [Russula compacta]|nr:hypothetical protein BJV74DRAFT_136248 [Russula compacta]
MGPIPDPPSPQSPCLTRLTGNEMCEACTRTRCRCKSKEDRQERPQEVPISLRDYGSAPVVTISFTCQALIHRLVDPGAKKWFKLLPHYARCMVRGKGTKQAKLTSIRHGFAGSDFTVPAQLIFLPVPELEESTLIQPRASREPRLPTKRCITQLSETLEPDNNSVL